MAALRKLTHDDLWTFKEMGAIALSPDGGHVAFVIVGADKAKNERHSNIWLLPLDEQGRAAGEPRQLTSGIKNDTNPVWAPDSKHLLFLSNREEDKNQLWLINTQGGEARQLTNMLRGVSEAAWSPDGRWIAFTAVAALFVEEKVVVGGEKPGGGEREKSGEGERLRPPAIYPAWGPGDGRRLL